MRKRGCGLDGTPGFRGSGRGLIEILQLFPAQVVLLLRGSCGGSSDLRRSGSVPPGCGGRCGSGIRFRLRGFGRGPGLAVDDGPAGGRA